MSKQYMFDVETLGIESTAVIASMAAIPFDFDEDLTYQDYLDRALFVKFNIEEQIKILKRSITPSSIEWWKAQDHGPRLKSIIPHPGIDVSAKEGIEKLDDFIVKEKGEKVYAWARGGLDQVTLDSLTRAVRGIEADPIIAYNNWLDVRTALGLMKETAGNGYCQIPGFNREVVVKHDPVHDCAYDIMMLVKGK